MTVAIVGAGMAGLACAQQLKNSGVGAVLFDKGTRPGGRLSSLVLEDGEWDFGAQYLTVQGAAFAEQVGRWQDDRLVAPWHGGPDDALVGVPNMGALVAALCLDHDVRFGARVERLDRTAAGWSLLGPGLSAGPFAAVVIAIPAEQTAPLVALHDLGMASDVATARSRPCWTVMATFAERLTTVPDYVSDRGAIAWAARNNSKPARGAAECWVIQAGTAWSIENLEADRGEVADRLLCAFARDVGIDLPDPTFCTAHRWRFGLPYGQQGNVLWNGPLGLGACGDWSLGPQIEGAWLSGLAMADRVLSSLIPSQRRAAG